MKVGILFKSEVGEINFEYTAGAERTFLQDLEIFQKNEIEYKAFCAGRVINNNEKLVIKTLFYPRFFYKFRKIFNDCHFLFIVFDYALILADFLYSFQFFLQTRDCDVLYAYHTPILALINPQKTIIAYQNFYKIPLYEVFKNRYLKAKHYFCSQYLMNQYFRTHKDLNKARSTVIHNGIDQKLFSPLTKKKKRNVTFLYASSWRECKGIFLLLESIKWLEAQKDVRARFLIAGSSDLWYSDDDGENSLMRRKVEKIIEGLEMVRIIGRVKYSDLKRVYQKVDCLILPSTWDEPFALTNIESISCGVPVIAFDVGGNSEIIKNNVTGFLLKRKSSELLAEKIQDICSRPKILARMRVKCLNSAKKFSLGERQKRFLKFLGEK